MGTLAVEGAEAVNLLGGKFKVLTSTDQIKELQTIIRDKDTSRSDFKFVADRLIRMVIEEGLNQLPYQVLSVKYLEIRVSIRRIFSRSVKSLPPLVASILVLSMKRATAESPLSGGRLDGI